MGAGGSVVNSMKRIASIVAMELVLAMAGCGTEVPTSGGSGGTSVGGSDAGPGFSGGSGGRGGGQPGGAGGSGGTAVDSGTDGSVLVPCASAPPCDLGQLPVRVAIPALGQLECACAANPCDSGFPTCDCAQPVCARYGATCTGYAPGSGYLTCTTPG
jgi:hypothetical protein